MNSAFRIASCVWDSLIYGAGYGAVQNLIRQPKPLDPDVLWRLINPEKPRPSWLDHYPPGWMRRLLLTAKMRQEHRVGISAHYDVSNEFYELFLDRKYMFYTCADFHHSTDTLEEAQTHKADYIVRWLDPRAGEKILELGCGWGAMLKRIHEETGDRDNLFGYTLSEEQVHHNTQHHRFQVEFKNFITCDYPHQAFDKIYSIGAWEHVRHGDLDPLLNKLHQTLKPAGKMVHHFICPLSDQVTNDVVIAQLFFPGSYIPGFATQQAAFENAGFRFTRRSIHDYRPTLRAWFERLADQRDRAIELVGLRTYNRYLVFFAASHSYFQRGQAMLVRWELEKAEAA